MRQGRRARRFFFGPLTTTILGIDACKWEDGVKLDLCPAHDTEIRDLLKRREGREIVIGEHLGSARRIEDASR